MPRAVESTADGGIPGTRMLYTPVERQVRTLYVPEDYMDRLAARAAAGTLFPKVPAAVTTVVHHQADYLQVAIVDYPSARQLHFNTLEVWRVDRQTIRFRVRYRCPRGEGLRELWRNAPAPPVMVAMVPVFAALSVIVPEVLLLPIVGLAATNRNAGIELHPLGRQLKAIADNAA